MPIMLQQCVSTATCTVIYTACIDAAGPEQVKWSSQLRSFQTNPCKSQLDSETTMHCVFIVFAAPIEGYSSLYRGEGILLLLL